MKKIIFFLLIITTVFMLDAVEITFRYFDGTIITRQYDPNTEMLRFTLGTGRNIVEILGLEQFKNLRELWLGMTAFMESYDFLKKLTTLEVLVFQDIYFSNIDFIYSLSSLRKLIFQNCGVNSKIDASRLPYLEYFEFTNSQLNEFPIKIVEKRNINTINIAFNNITFIPVADYKCILIIATGNPISDTGNPNIITSGRSFFHTVPERYRRFVR